MQSYLAKKFSILTLACLVLIGCEVNDGVGVEQKLIDIAKLDKTTQNLYKQLQEKDITKLKELQKESDAGNSDASKILGLIYLQGKYTKKNIELAIEKFKESANSGDKEAAKILYDIYNSKKYKETHQREAEEYGEIAGLIKIKNYSSQKTIEKIKENISKNKWENFEERSERLTGFGSSVAINKKGYFVTNRHVVEGCRRVVIRYNNMLGRAVSIAIGSDADVALIKVNGSTPAYLQFMTKKPELGEKIYVGGYPLVEKLGADLKMTDGIVSGESSDKQSFIQITASISSGNSGGPVVDEKNRIVGIATGSLTNRNSNNTIVGHGINFATHNEAIIKFLNTNNITYDTQEKGSILSSREVAEFLKLATALVICLE
jgi:S1-C subfamily serine protease